jgi:DNA polymerase I-like protein with 3'-5' exonuclease and polymerase domains
MAAHLSQDPVMLHEIRNNIDQHAATCTDIMELEMTKPNRVLAKICNFRMIYADPENSWYGYYMDVKMPNFSEEKWKGIVAGFFNKYTGLAEWHDKIIDQVYNEGQYTGPTGRFWKFKKVNKKGVFDYSTGQIRNYMVQGTSGDIIKMAMVIINKRRKAMGLTKSKLIMCVHDSIIWDSPEEEVYQLAKLNLEVFREIPQVCKRVFGFDLLVPIDGEAAIGDTWGNVQEYKE